MGAEISEAITLSVVHTVLTDVLGHEKHGVYVRRASYHDTLSLALGFMIALFTQNPLYLWLGAIHVMLDWLSPGRLGVNYLYSLMWAAVPAIILYIFGVYH